MTDETILLIQRLYDEGMGITDILDRLPNISFFDVQAAVWGNIDDTEEDYDYDYPMDDDYDYMAPHEDDYQYDEHY